MSRSIKNPIVLRGPQEVMSYCEALSQRYDELPSYEADEVWRWELLAKHVEKLYRRILSRVDVVFVDGQPYDDAQQMRDEVARTGVLYISKDYNEHPVFSPETNLKFRAVHDYVVHISPGPRGPDFTDRGELRAYNLHRRLVPPESWPALFTEVAGQACYANARGEFPEQKIAVFRDVDFYNVGEFMTPKAAKQLKAKLLR